MIELVLGFHEGNQSPILGKYLARTADYSAGLEGPSSTA